MVSSAVAWVVLSEGVAWAFKVNAGKLPTGTVAAGRLPTGTLTMLASVDVTVKGAWPPVTWNAITSVTCAFADAGDVCSSGLSAQRSCADSTLIVAVAT